MLSGREQAVMAAVYTLCKDHASRLIAPSNLLNGLPQNYKTDEEGLEKQLLGLQAEGYFDLIPSDRKGEKVYVISLTNKGGNFPQEQRKQRRQLVFRVLFTLCGAVASFLIGLILRRIFS